MFSTEKFLEDLKQTQKADPNDAKARPIVAGPREWLASLKMEKCKVRYETLLLASNHFTHV